MSIVERIEDGLMLARAKRYSGALTNFLLAIAGSSRKALPLGTPSQHDPKKKMGDGEAFRLFLGGRLQRVLFSDTEGPEFTEGALMLPFENKMHSLPQLFYGVCRNSLVHEAGLPTKVKFVPDDTKLPEGKGLVLALNGFKAIAWRDATTMMLNHGWLDVLHAAVVTAPCNAEEFPHAPPLPTSNFQIRIEP